MDDNETMETMMKMMMMIGSGRIMDGGARSSSGQDAAREGIQLSGISTKFRTYLLDYHQYFYQIQNISLRVSPKMLPISGHICQINTNISTKFIKYWLDYHQYFYQIQNIFTHHQDHISKDSHQLQQPNMWVGRDHSSFLLK